MRRWINISYKYVKKLNDIVKENLQKNKMAKSEKEAVFMEANVPIVYRLKRRQKKNKRFLGVNPRIKPLKLKLPSVLIAPQKRRIIKLAAAKKDSRANPIWISTKPPKRNAAARKRN